MFDLIKHIGSSLSQALSDFGCNVQKGEFDHTKACRWEDMLNSMRNECLVYLQSDVLGLRELFNKLNEQCYKDFRRDITNFISTSSLGFDIWKSYIPKGVMVDLSDSTEVETNIRKSTVIVLFFAGTYFREFPSAYKFTGIWFRGIVIRLTLFIAIYAYLYVFACIYFRGKVLTAKFVKICTPRK